MELAQKTPPYLGKSFDYDAADERITQEMGRCAEQYDDARKDLAEQHGKMGDEEKRILADLAKIKPHVDGVMDGGHGLTRGKARACIDYLRLLQRLKRVRQAQRLAYGATVKPGEVKLGSAMGVPTRVDTGVE